MEVKDASAHKTDTDHEAVDVDLIFLSGSSPGLFHLCLLKNFSYKIMPPRRTHPDFSSYHLSLSKELFALKDRIRNLARHWQTDGEYKEVALRNLLRRHLPESVIIGRGFIVTPDDSSTQIDILIVSANKPMLFKEGDLLIVTPDAVLGVIEVKTEPRTYHDFEEALIKLSNIEKMCRQATGRDSVWTGLFSFEDHPRQQRTILRALGSAYRETDQKVNCVSCGHNVFIRFWDDGRQVESPVNGPVWHSYALPHVAPSYFIGNLVDSISTVDNNSAGFAWFPVLGGKERYLDYYLSLHDIDPTPL